MEMECQTKDAFFIIISIKHSSLILIKRGFAIKELGFRCISKIRTRIVYCCIDLKKPIPIR